MALGDYFSGPQAAAEKQGVFLGGEGLAPFDDRRLQGQRGLHRGRQVA